MRKRYHGFSINILLRPRSKSKIVVFLSLFSCLQEQSVQTKWGRKRIEYNHANFKPDHLWNLIGTTVRDRTKCTNDWDSLNSEPNLIIRKIVF